MDIKQLRLMFMIHITEQNFDREVMKSDIPVVIDFWAPWCGPCQMMAPVFEELAKEYEGKAKLVKLNTDEYPALAQPFGIQGIPTLLILKKGKEAGRIVGFGPKHVMKQRIDAVL